MQCHLREKLFAQFGTQQSMRAEATYYLEVTNYDLSKAMDEFDEDAKFEKEQEKIFKGLKGKKKGMTPLLYLSKK